jgi:hypothetical protein
LFSRELHRQRGGTLQFPRTVPNGTRFAGLNCEAVALVAAGAAVLI